MATKVIEKSVERQVPVIKAAALKWNSEGFAWREAFVRLPQGATLQDLNDHSHIIWKHVQGSAQTSLRQWDQVRLVSFDEAWIVDATVSFADGAKVILAGIKKTDLPERSAAVFQDETYKVDWAGSGYAVFRKADGVLMGNQAFSVPEQAKQHLLSLYPQKKVVA